MSDDDKPVFEIKDDAGTEVFRIMPDRSSSIADWGAITRTAIDVVTRDPALPVTDGEMLCLALWLVHSGAVIDT